jgi:hypothetical protein
MGIFRGLIVGIMALIMLITVYGIANAETIIIDNGGSGTSHEGIWLSSGGLEPYGNDSVYSKTVDDIYTFETAINGSCEVSLWWTEWVSRSTNVPIKIYNGDVLLDTVFVNQVTNGGQWNMLGVYSFTDVVRVVIVSEGNGVTVCADAVKIEQQVETVEIDITIAWTKPDNTYNWAGLWIRVNGDDSTVIDIIDPGPVIWQGVLTLSIGENVFEMLAYDINDQHSEWSDPAYYTPGQEIPRAPIGVSVKATE